MDIIYKFDVIPPVDMVIDSYTNADMPRPVADRLRMIKMFENSNLVISAWSD